MENIVNPVADRLFRHMKWANQQVFSSLQKLTLEQSRLCAPGSDWSIQKIAFHLVDAQRWYVWRLTKDETFLKDLSGQASDYESLAASLLEADQRLRFEVSLPEEMTEYERDGQRVIRARSTILAQSIHHATEHRAQIADVLAAHDLQLINLDELDLWAYGDVEGLGA